METLYKQNPWLAQDIEYYILDNADKYETDNIDDCDELDEISYIHDKVKRKYNINVSPKEIYNILDNFNP